MINFMLCKFYLKKFNYSNNNRTWIIILIMAFRKKIKIAQISQTYVEKNILSEIKSTTLFHGAKMLSVQETCLGARISLASKCKYWKGAIAYVLWCQKYLLFSFFLSNQFSHRKKTLLIAPPIKGFQGIKNKIM